MTPQPPSENGIDPITPEAARAILEEAIRQRIGADWREESSGWQMVTGHDYMARLTRGRVNLDFYVDLLGAVRIEESATNSAQESGRLIAWAFLIVSLVIALMLARIVGWL